MRIFLFSALMVISCVAFGGCGEDVNISSPDPDGEGCPPGDTLWARTGEVFDLVLYNDLYDAAYVWTFIDRFSDRMLEYIGYALVPTVTDPYFYGAPVNEIYTYRALRAGTTCACLELKRPFGDYPSADTKNIVIIVRN